MIRPKLPQIKEIHIHTQTLKEQRTNRQNEKFCAPWHNLVKTLSMYNKKSILKAVRKKKTYIKDSS